MMIEVDQQVSMAAETSTNLVVVPVGVGSLAQAVVSHYKSKSTRCSVLTVEPTSAACLKASLTAGKLEQIETEETIMTGMNCGTVSSIAWPLLSMGVDACTSVSDFSSYQAVQSLAKMGGIQAGPCGAAPLAALQQLTHQKRDFLDLDEGSTVVLLCTEGARRYTIPLDGA
jgi:threonine dehydratase